MKHRINLSPSIGNRNDSASCERTGSKEREKETTAMSSSALPPSLPTSRSSIMAIKSEEKGHRLGNFHNYYTFNPTSNRISILKNLGIIRYLSEQFALIDESHDDEDHHDNERLSKRLKSSQAVAPASSTKSVTKAKKRRDPITYCDLGCNEGDLSISLSEHLVQPQLQRTTPLSKKEETPTEKQGHSTSKINCLGLDIDSTLIDRANRKYNHTEIQNDLDDNTAGGRLIDASFQVCNIANITELKSKCYDFLQSVQEHHQQGENCEQKGDEEKQERFDLISLFSTSMWIHIHHGDDGLQLLLRTICTLCNYILIEPQPSKCYRNVNTRLRKLNLEEVDVSLVRLKMRCDIENEIEKVILGCGFEEVDISLQFKDNKDLKDTKDKKRDKNGTDRTAWNRTLRLYKRNDY